MWMCSRWDVGRIAMEADNARCPRRRRGRGLRRWTWKRGGGSRVTGRFSVGQVERGPAYRRVRHSAPVVCLASPHDPLMPQLEDQSRGRGNLPPNRPDCNDHPAVHHLRPGRLFLHGEPASIHSVHDHPFIRLTPKVAAHCYTSALCDAGKVAAVPPGLWRRDHAIPVSCSASIIQHISFK